MSLFISVLLADSQATIVQRKMISRTSLAKTRADNYSANLHLTELLWAVMRSVGILISFITMSSNPADIEYRSAPPPMTPECDV